MPRKRRSPVRVSAKLHVDLLEVAQRALDLSKGARRFIRRVVDASPIREYRHPLVTWHAVPVGSLVMTTDGELTRVFLRSSEASGALVSAFRAGERVTCDDSFEHEPWAALERRRGCALVRVLARRVGPGEPPAKLASRIVKALESMQ